MMLRHLCIKVCIGVCGFGISCTVSSAQTSEFPPDESIYGIQPTPDQREHWSFQRLRSGHDFPVEDPTHWVRNPIDAYVLSSLKSKGLTPSPPASAQVWLRRVYFDLIGLPPSPVEIEEFLQDPSDAARERIVDRLLANPGYGIRWGRRWLDTVRYADTNGYERDGDKPSVWRYRDYVIDSLNQDKPFDRFLTEQIAGDEVSDVTADSMVGTTFLRLGTWDDEPADPLVDRYDQLDDVVRAVSTTFLGLTLSCARCHNHKFEPLSQIDYTRMLAVFAPLERPQIGRNEFDRPVGHPSEITAFEAVNQRADRALQQITQQLNELQSSVHQRLFQQGHASLEKTVLDAFKSETKGRTAEQKALVKLHQTAFERALETVYSSDEKRQKVQFEAAIEELKKAFPTALPRAYVFQENPENSRPVQVFRRGDPQTPAGVVEPGIPVVLAVDSPVLKYSSPQHTKTTGRRLALARWMCSPDHPLVSRVIANRIWQGHFGEGLVRTENDFGIMGYPPTHPELLDWLAESLLRFDWRLKSLHRLIVLSNTYAQASSDRVDANKIDADNRLLWRFPFFRLDAEPLRDAMMAANGSLNFAMNGPGIYPNIGPEVLASQSRPGNGWGQSSVVDKSRRTAYVFVKRSLLLPFLELMDLPDTTTSCEQRNISTIPTQALTLMNGDFLQEQAALLGRRIALEAGPDLARQINYAFLLTLSRAPTSEEQTAALAFVGQAGAHPEAQAKAMRALCVVIYNLNEFFYVD